MVISNLVYFINIHQGATLRVRCWVGFTLDFATQSSLFIRNCYFTVNFLIIRTLVVRKKICPWAVLFVCVDSAGVEAIDLVPDTKYVVLTIDCTRVLYSMRRLPCIEFRDYSTPICRWLGVDMLHSQYIKVITWPATETYCLILMWLVLYVSLQRVVDLCIARD